MSRVELFARRKTPGWDVWGNEVESDISLTEIENSLLNGSEVKKIASSTPQVHENKMGAQTALE